MTLYEAYCFGEQELKNRNIEDASLDAWYLLEFATGISRARYYSEPSAGRKQTRPSNSIIIYAPFPGRQDRNRTFMILKH